VTGSDGRAVDDFVIEFVTDFVGFVDVVVLNNCLLIQMAMALGRRTSFYA